MATIQAQKIPQKVPSANEILTTFCLYYPAYTFRMAQNMPYRRVVYMVRQARRHEARRMIELTRIIAAPHTDKGKGIQKVIELYQEILNS